MPVGYVSRITVKRIDPNHIRPVTGLLQRRNQLFQIGLHRVEAAPIRLAGIQVVGIAKCEGLHRLAAGGHQLQSAHVVVIG